MGRWGWGVLVVDMVNCHLGSAPVMLAFFIAIKFRLKCFARKQTDCLECQTTKQTQQKTLQENFVVHVFEFCLALVLCLGVAPWRIDVNLAWPLAFWHRCNWRICTSNAGGVCF